MREFFRGNLILIVMLAMLPMNLVAADVRRLKLIAIEDVGASLRRLLRFKGSMRESFGEFSPPLHTFTPSRRRLFGFRILHGCNAG
jgi:hypothetical protein